MGMCMTIPTPALSGSGIRVMSIYSNLSQKAPLGLLNSRVFSYHAKSERSVTGKLAIAIVEWEFIRVK
jgi:hypothetical protein